jgi:hypothetical protein
VLELVQAKEAPGGLLRKAWTEIRSAGQTESLAMGEIKGVGLMVTEKFNVPLQPLRRELTVMLPVIGKVVLFWGANQNGILPEPEAARPIAILELDQEKAAPDGLLAKVGISIRPPGQTEMLLMEVITGVGLIVIVKM